MRAFLSPAEDRLLASLPAREADVVRALMDVLDARLVETAEADGQERLFDASVAA